LKGSTKDREATAKEKAKTTPVLLDLDFTAINRKIYCGGAKEQFMLQLKTDASFLSRCNCMDYSFLVGIHKVTDNQKLPIKPETITFHSELGANVCHIVSTDAKEIYFMGIIDHFTVYDVEKKVAHGAKSFKYKPNELSTVNAQFYCDRFCSFIDSILE